MTDYLLQSLAPIAHNGQSLGTISYLRREKFLLDQVTDIPVLSGNSIRGALRDHAAESYFSWLGTKDLPLPVLQLLFSGGAITKAKGEPLSGEELRLVREACPVLALFGGSVAGRVLSGRLNVGKLLPVCQETLSLIPFDIKDAPNLWDITQVAEYSRFPDLAVSTENGGTMRYGVETFITGTQFHWWVSATTYTSTESNLLDFLVSSISQGQVLVGGSKRQGFGRVKIIETTPTLQPKTVIDPWVDMTIGQEQAIELLTKFIR